MSGWVLTESESFRITLLVMSLGGVKGNRKNMPERPGHLILTDRLRIDNRTSFLAQLLKVRRVTIRRAEPSARLSENIWLSEGFSLASARVSSRVCRGLQGSTGLGEGSDPVLVTLWNCWTNGALIRRHHLGICTKQHKQIFRDYSKDFTTRA